MADIEFQKEETIIENEDLKKTVMPDTPLKNWLVNYVGENHNPDDGEVTVEMIVNTIADEFPEFLLVVAEENFLRGYEQALDDVEVGNSLVSLGDMLPVPNE
jgi:hypothetical protein|tara:strand:- start:2437 stop:2742 length:306 start_codon:yes stop_codon:yes gene_type:complete